MAEIYNVLILGNGELETLIAKHISMSPSLGKLYAIPGNPDLCNICTLCDSSNTSFLNIQKFVKEHNIHIVIPGLSCPIDLDDVRDLESDTTNVFISSNDIDALKIKRTNLREYLKSVSIATPQAQHYDHVDGAVQYLETLCYPLAVRIESKEHTAKRYCKNEADVLSFVHETIRDFVIERNGVKIYIHNKLFTEEDEVKNYIANLAFPIMTKTNCTRFASTTKCNNKEEFKEFLSQAIKAQIYGEDGMDVLIENYLEGAKLNVTALVDGKVVLLFPFIRHIMLPQENQGFRAFLTSPTVVPKKDWINFEKMLIMPTIHAINNYCNISKDDDENRNKYKGLLSLEIVWAKNIPQIVDIKFDWDLWTLYALLETFEADWLQLIAHFLHGNMEEANIQWSAKTILGMFSSVNDEETNNEIQEAFKEDNLFDTSTIFYPTIEKASRLSNCHGSGVVFKGDTFQKSYDEIVEYWKNREFSDQSLFLSSLNLIKETLSITRNVKK